MNFISLVSKAYKLVNNMPKTTEGVIVEMGKLLKESGLKIENGETFILDSSGVIHGKILKVYDVPNESGEVSKETVIQILKYYPFDSVPTSAKIIEIQQTEIENQKILNV